MKFYSHLVLSFTCSGFFLSVSSLEEANIDCGNGAKCPGGLLETQESSGNVPEISVPVKHPKVNKPLCWKSDKHGMKRPCRHIEEKNKTFSSITMEKPRRNLTGSFNFTRQIFALPDRSWNARGVSKYNKRGKNGGSSGNSSLSGNLTNITEHTLIVSYDLFQYIFDTILGVFLVVFGLVGNIICLIVLPKHRSQRPAMMLLTGLALADSLVLVLSVFDKITPSICLYNGLANCYVLFRDDIIPYLFPVSRISQTFAIWMVVGVTIDRYIAITRPFETAKFCTVKRATFIIMLTGLSSILFHVPHFIQYVEIQELKEIENQNNSHKDLWRLRTLQTVGGNQYYNYIYYIGCNWLFVFVIPLCVLSVLNILLWFAVKKAKSEHARLTQGTATDKDNLTVTLNIIIIVSLFLVCQTPRFICIILLTPDFGFPSSSLSRFVSVAGFLLALNSSLNFYVYFLGYRKFRRLTVDVLCCRYERKPRLSISDYSSNTRSSLLPSRDSKGNIDSK